jgi:hypothetical protein
MTEGGEMQKLVWCICLILVVVLVPSIASAQASIGGNVKDTSGAVLPGVTVEAASSSLIEGARSTLTDENGHYRILDLRPGTYTVTFSLPGFTEVKHRLDLAGSFAAVVDGELRVGSVQESLTVTDVAPQVDVQDVRLETVLPKETLDVLPAGRNYQNLAALVPGMTVNGAQDVGGLRGDAYRKVMIHGSVQTDMDVRLDGLDYTAGAAVLSGVSEAGGVMDVGSAQEVVTSYSSGLGEAMGGGVHINVIPREGGNRFHGSVLALFGNESMQSNNITPALAAAGLPTPNSLKSTYDLNIGFGGPIKRNRLWFYTSTRLQETDTYAAGAFFNANAGNPSSWTYSPDTAHKAYNNPRNPMASIRLTWQVTDKQKISALLERQKRIDGDYSGVSATTAPEATTYSAFEWHDRWQLSWTDSVSAHWLINAGLSWDGGTWDSIGKLDRYGSAGTSAMIPAVEQTTGLSFRAPQSKLSNPYYNNGVQGSVAYTAGPHTAKFGASFYQSDYNQRHYDPPIIYRLNNGVPNQITENLTPWAQEQKAPESAIFAQDQWRLGRATLNGGVRLDILKRFYSAETLGPAYLDPSRHLTFAEASDINWKDITPRAGIAYDVFGNGSTAVTVSLGKYPTRGFYPGPSVLFGNAPVAALALSTTRAWTDKNGNFAVDCDLLNKGSQDNTATGGDICGPMSNQAFGSAVPVTQYDPAIESGWGKRQYNWEFASGIQRQVTKGLSANFSVFRRSFGNFLVVKNLSVSASDYTFYSVPVPTDPRLPGGGGGTISGLADISGTKYGQVSNLLTFAKNYGNQLSTWSGYDATANLRLGHLLMQGGISSGQSVTDNCSAATKLPEILGSTPLQFCHQASGFLTQLKYFGSYMVPKIAVELTGTVQSIPGSNIAANYPVPSAIAAQSLGRPLSGGVANATWNIVQPNTLLTNRINQLDLRLTKLFPVGERHVRAGLDIYNALNASPVTGFNQSYGAAWLRPTSALSPRFLKISLQADF